MSGGACPEQRQSLKTQDRNYFFQPGFSEGDPTGNHVYILLSYN